MLTATMVALLLVSLAAAAVYVIRARSQRDRYRSLVDDLPHAAIAVFDREQRFEEIFGRSTRNAGLDTSMVRGKHVTEVMAGPDGEQYAAELRRAVEGETRAFEFHSPLTGRDFWVQVAPRTEGGQIVGAVAVGQNVTDQRSAERMLTAEEDRRQVMLEAMNEAYVATDAAGVVTEWNRAAEMTFGYSAAEAIGRPLAGLIIPERDRPDLTRMLGWRLDLGSGPRRRDIRAERQALHRDGHEFTVELAATLVEIGGEVTLHALMHDISDRKRAEEEMRQHAEDVEAISAAIGELARSTVATEARGAICRAATLVSGAAFAVLFEPDPSGTGLRATGSHEFEHAGTLLPFTSRAGSIAAFTSSEMLFHADFRSSPAFADSIIAHDPRAVSALWLPVQRGADEAPVGVIAVAWEERVEELSDRLERIMGVISAEAAVAIERAGMLDRLERMARTDDLTGLVNRRAWDIELARALLRTERDGAPLAVAMLDLDRFKDYNDEHGHQAGDRLLKEAAVAWREVLRESDLIARYGGEEFAVVMPGCGAEAAMGLVERLRAATPGGGSCSAGLATWDGEESADDLLGRADDALYVAKQAGRDRTILASA